MKEKKLNLKNRQTTGLRRCPRYSTPLFLSRTATDDPGSARLSVRARAVLKLDFELGLGTMNAFYFT